MSNQEAIALLKNLEDSLDSYCELNEEGKTAFRMAIEALNISETPNSSDTISRAKAIDALRKMQTYKLFSGDDMLLIDQAGAMTELMLLPSAEPERIKGRWIEKPHVHGVAYCSLCDYELHTNDTNFCPNCGAKMDGEVTT